MQDNLLRDYARIRAKEVSERNSKYRPNGKLFNTLYDEFLGEKGVNMQEARSSMGQPKSVIKDWLRNEEARKVLLAPNVHRYSVGVYKNGASYYWVLVTIVN